MSKINTTALIELTDDSILLLCHADVISTYLEKLEDVPSENEKELRILRNAVDELTMLCERYHESLKTIYESSIFE